MMFAPRPFTLKNLATGIFKYTLLRKNYFGQISATILTDTMGD
jgi:hypothetical protein